MDIVRFSRSDLVDVVFKTLEYDKHRMRHSVDSLLRELAAMGVMRTGAGLTERYERGTWYIDAVRRVIVSLIESGQLDMDIDGHLSPGPETPEPIIEQFQGSYFTVKDGRVAGPFATSEGAILALHP